MGPVLAQQGGGGTVCRLTRPSASISITPAGSILSKAINALIMQCFGNPARKLLVGQCQLLGQMGDLLLKRQIGVNQLAGYPG